MTFISFVVIFLPLFFSLALFVLNSHNYHKKGPRGNVFYKFLKIVFFGCSATREPNAKHWLDKAKRVYTPQEVEDAKAVLRVLVIFIPLPFFWAVFFQMYSVWIFQARQMNCQIGSFLIPASTTAAINGIMDVILIPLFDSAIYPIIGRFFKFTKLRRIGAGHLFTIAALIVAAFVCLRIQETPCTTSDGGITFNCPTGALHVAWIIPQYLLISCAEILLSISGLEFAYEEAPASMKGSITAIFLVTTAVGNAMISVLTLIDATPAIKNFIFAGLIFVVLIFFTFVAYFYQHRGDATEEEETRALTLNAHHEHGNDNTGNDTGSMTDFSKTN